MNYTKDDFIFNEDKTSVIQCPCGQAALKSEYIKAKREYRVLFNTETCLKCDELPRCEGRFQGKYYTIMLRNTNIRTIDDSLRLFSKEDRKFDDFIYVSLNKVLREVDLFTTVIASGEAYRASSYVEAGQRATLIGILVYIRHFADVINQINDLKKVITILIHNFTVYIERSNWTKYRNINTCEKRVMSEIAREIEGLLNVIDKLDLKEKIFCVLNIKKWASLGSVLLDKKILDENSYNINIHALLNDDVIVEGVFIIPNKIDEKIKGINYIWRYNGNDRGDNLYNEYSKKYEEYRNKSYDKNKVIYNKYYDEACECFRNMELEEAEDLFNKIIECDQIYEYTSGAYVSLAAIELYKNSSTDDSLRKKVELLLNKALEINPSNVKVPMTFIQLYMRSLDYKQALYWLKKCREDNYKSVLDDLETKLQESLPYYRIMNHLDKEYNKRFNSQEAYEFYCEAASIFPDNLYLQCTVASILQLREETGLLKAYEIYQTIMSKYPNVHLGYMLAAEACGNGYLNRPHECIMYCEKAIQLLDSETKNIRATLDKMEYFEYKFHVEGILINALISLKRYDEAIKLLKKRVQENPNNNDIHNLALALYFVKNYEESIAYCQRELFIEEDELSFTLLGKNFYSLKEYGKAAEFFKKALSFMNDNDTGLLFFKDENGNETISFSKREWELKRLEEIYVPLIDCYFRQGDYITAKGIWLIAKEQFPEQTSIDVWGNIIDQTLDISGRTERMNEQYLAIKQELEGEREKNRNKDKTIRQWAVELMKIQGDVGDIEEMDEDTWELFSEKIENTISKMTTDMKLSNSYAEIKADFRRSFPKLEENSLEFLTTAEYLYRINMNNIIDFAPIMVEYCKVIENELRVVLVAKDMMLGNALKHIKNLNISPLIHKYNQLNEIYTYRNGSAHTGLSTKEKVEKVRQLFFDRGVLKTICSMK